jgi:pimeloyl-ACP methyl ester carboxylesterase
MGGVDTRVLDRGVLAEGLRADDASGYPWLVQAFRNGIEMMGNDRLALAAHAESYKHGGISGLERIKAPTLLIAGDADPLAVNPERLAAAIPDCQLAIVPGDHVQARLVPEFAAATMNFLR